MKRWLLGKYRGMRDIHVLTGMALVGMSLATGLVVMFPMALCGGVENRESIAVIRWGELAACVGCIALGIVAIRKR